MSSSTGHSVVESMLSSTYVECLNLTSTSLNCSERNSFAMSCLSFLGIPTLEQTFSGLSELHMLPWACPKAQTSCTVLQTQCKIGILTVILVWKFSSFLSTPSPVSVLAVSLPVVVLDSFWSWPKRTTCFHNQVPPLSLVHSWPNLLDWKDLIFYAISLNFNIDAFGAHLQF